MMIEERLEQLEEKVTSLTQEVNDLRSRDKEVWASPSEVATRLHCSYNNVIIKLRSGEIYGDKSTGKWVVPMSQFHRPIIKNEKSQDVVNRSLREVVFGKEV